MTLADLWFVLIAVLWVGFFILEGFDFGVGMLVRILGKDDTDRRLMINSVGPLWDGNEVWLITAGGATFAAFPDWYATLFSGFYLPLFFILVALIVRGVAFEFRGKRDEPKWKNAWDWAIFGGALIPSILLGVAFANIVRGVKINADFEYVGGFFDLLNPYALLGGVMTLMLFLVHGAVFIALKTDGDLAERSNRLAHRLSWPTGGVVIGFLVATYFVAKHNGHTGLVQWYIPVTAMALIVAAGWLLRERMNEWAFAATAGTIALIISTFFLNMYPRVMPSSLNDSFSLTVQNASSSHYTLVVMSVVALAFLPIVLGYQVWTYWVFRKRLVRPHQDTGMSGEVTAKT